VLITLGAGYYICLIEEAHERLKQVSFQHRDESVFTEDQVVDDWYGAVAKVSRLATALFIYLLLKHL